MRKFFQILFLLPVAVTMTSCYSLEQLPVDYLVASNVNFPAQVKRVGVVNNMSLYPDNEIMVEDSLKSPLELARKTSYFNGEPVIATEALAKAIANQNYFDEVLICDSALRANDIQPRETTLSRNEVSELSGKLNADVIVALENLQIKVTRIISVIPGGGFWGTVDAKIYPVIRLYLPNRDKPYMMVQPQDSIFWEDTHYSDVRLRAALISDEEVVREASEHAGEIPAKYLTPFWQTVNRFYYTGGSAEMRDAAIFVRNNEWDAARECWEKVYAGNNKKKKMHAAFNLALAYEMNDNFDKAAEWLQKALELVKTQEKKENIIINSEPEQVSNRILYEFYAEELRKRKENAFKLNVQMERFNLKD